MRLAVAILYYQHMLSTPFAPTSADEKEHLLGASGVDIARPQDEVYNERLLQVRIRKFLAYSKELLRPEYSDQLHTPSTLLYTTRSSLTLSSIIYSIL